MQNNPIKTIFVCEFITGGGLNHSELDSSLVSEGLLMRDALLKDLSTLPYELFVTVDARLLSPDAMTHMQSISATDDVWEKWDKLISQVDAVWIIAPETDGYLQKLTSLVLKHQKIVIGCGLTTIDVCRSKLSSYYFFKQHDLHTIHTYLSTNWDKTLSRKWVVKPDDGAGCEETRLFDRADVMDWIVNQHKTRTHVIQPYIEGSPASISCIMHKGHAQVLSCNEQLISINNNVLSYRGFVINGMQVYWKHFAALAEKIAKLLPDANGYVGIDVIVCDTGKKQPELMILEVNPRLTTTYVGLGEATGLNPAKLIIDTITETYHDQLKMDKNEVLLKVGHA